MVSPGMTDAAGADAAMTGVMNAMGQEGEFSHKQMPIKNRVNGLDVSENYLRLITHWFANREIPRRQLKC